ncbi:vitamin K epoxide reductase family protein [Streptosporangium sandarakinum]|uniref:Putative membrane protein n=1 Tax=Streptosporangium sandarakinum TaxID=1260955 RepID=A0A852UUN2_9ACTN|nr:vitamin K epoxide reductase family protein [Streptosporangium sandarakinum]NYF38953.1 putative membrane protein [Streptosporangium sandarakinum]
MVGNIDPRVGTAPVRSPGLLTAMRLLTLVGLAVSVYLTVVHYNDVPLICSESATIDCASVTTSEYSKLFGIPVPLLGLVFFVGFGALVVSAAWSSTHPVLRWGRLAAVIVGTLFVVYLVTAELVLGKVCLWCTAVHVITVLLLGLVLTDEYRRLGSGT